MSHLLPLGEHGISCSRHLRLDHELLSLRLELVGAQQHAPAPLLRLVGPVGDLLQLVRRPALVVPLGRPLDIGLAGPLGLRLGVTLLLACLGPLLSLSLLSE